MKRTIPQIVSVVFLALALSAGGAAAQQNDPVTFDVKTRFCEKLDLTAAKNGAVLILMQSDWGGVREYGEDYALWLRDIRRSRIGDSIAVTLQVELRAASLLGEGELLGSGSISAVYHPQDDWSRYGSDDAVGLVRGVETCAEIGTAVAGIFYPAATAIVRTAAGGLELLMPGSLPQMKLEAMILGTKVALAARQMSGRHAGDTHEDTVDGGR